MKSRFKHDDEKMSRDAEMLIKYRTLAKLNQKEAAELLDVCQTSYCKMENGKQPSGHLLPRMKDVVKHNIIMEIERIQERLEYLNSILENL